MKILYDGWPLAYSGDDPDALHLLMLLEAHPPEFPALLALPAASFHALPPALAIETLRTPNTPVGRLSWEQRMLPNLARRIQAGAIHTVGGGLGLLGGALGIISPAGFPSTDGHKTGLAARLGTAMGQGGASQARAWLWPADLPNSALPAGMTAPPARLWRRLPPAVHPAFHPAPESWPPPPGDELARYDLPETFILYHGPAHPARLRRLLAAWGWAANSVGVDYPLLLVGLRDKAQDGLAELLAEYGLTGTARLLPPLALGALAELYRRSSVVIHTGELSPWSGVVRLALASGRPLAGVETSATAAIVGPAAYLAQRAPSAGDAARALGAALLSLVVEEALAEALSQAAQARAQSWNFDDFRRSLAHVYRTFKGGSAAPD